MRFPKLFAVALSTFLLAPGIGGAAAQKGPQVLRVVSGDVTDLDPTQGSSRVSRVYAQMVFDTLFALDSTLSAKPMMVESFSLSEDGLRRHYTLRSGLRFHDGSPVTARDVTASIARWMDNTSVGAQLKSRLATMTAEDDRNISLVLTEPFGLVEFLLAGAGSPIPAIMREADAKRPYNTPMPVPVIGSGPFRYVDGERLEGSRVVFARNPDYPARSEPTDGLAGARVVKVDRVEWLILPDATTASNALAAGQADFWAEADPDQIAFLRARGLRVRPNGLPFVSFVRPNFRFPPFNDVRARQAIALLVDQNEIMPAVAGDADWKTCYGFGVCGTALGTEAGAEPYRRLDVERARRLLAEAGYRGETIVLLSTPTGPNNVVAQVLAQRLRQAGVKVDLQVTDLPTLLQRVRNKDRTPATGGYHLFAYNATGSIWFHPLTNSALDLSCGGQNWPGFPCDEAGEALRQRFLRATDAASAKAAFGPFAEHLWQFLPYVPVGQWEVVNAYRANIAGVLHAYVQPYWNIEKR
ncbi:MAG: ABC transporter substrate-binding protein [Rhizobiales bacterium]|nr:ABC transporter substrate-binding protein [Hyphomicrobiales bacterium]